MKTAKTFRLSEQAIKRLESLKSETGTNETAIIEIALALFQRSIFQAIEDERTFGGVPSRDKRGEAPNVPDPNSMMEQAEQEALYKQFPALKGMNPVITTPHRKKRKRSK